MLIPARLLALLGVAAAVVAFAAAFVRMGEKPAGVYRLKGRPAPDPSCHLVVEVDRTSNEGALVQFGELDCPGHQREPALRVGPAWFKLPDRELGSHYNSVRRTVDDLHWVVVGDTDVFRSDDGGKSFKQLRLPDWSSGSRLRKERISGAELEELDFTVEAGLPRLDRLWDAVQEKPYEDNGVISRVERAKTAWPEHTGLTHSYVVLKSGDGGRTWNRPGAVD